MIDLSWNIRSDKLTWTDGLWSFISCWRNAWSLFVFDVNLLGIDRERGRGGLIENSINCLIFLFLNISAYFLKRYLQLFFDRFQEKSSLFLSGYFIALQHKIVFFFHHLCKFFHCEIFPDFKDLLLSFFQKLLKKLLFYDSCDFIDSFSYSIF